MFVEIILKAFGNKRQFQFPRFHWSLLKICDSRTRCMANIIIKLHYNTLYVNHSAGHYIKFWKFT